MANFMHFINQILGRSTGGSPVPNCYILTGIPRAGTTLTCKLLSEQEQVAGLNEPIPFRNLQSRKDGLARTRKSFASFRKSLIQNGTAPVRGRNGQITDNHFGQAAGGNRKKVIKRSVVHFEQSFQPGFKLFVKHNAVFTLLLQDLKADYPCYAMVRNPLALLGSWSTVSVPVSRGKMRYLSLLDPEGHRALEQKKGLLGRQLFLLDYYFKAYSALPGQQVLQYEDLIGTNGSLLANMIGQPYHPKTALSSKNKSEVYPRDRMLQLGNALLEEEAHHCWAFYERSEVEALYTYYERQG